MLDECWATVKAALQENVSPIAYDTWLKSLELYSMDDDTIVIKTRTTFHKNYIENTFLDFIKVTISHVMGRPMR